MILFNLSLVFFFFFLLKFAHYASASAPNIFDYQFSYSPLFPVNNGNGHVPATQSRSRARPSPKNYITILKDAFNSCFDPETLKYDQLNRAIQLNDIDSLKSYLLNNDSYCSALKLNFDTIFDSNNQDLLSAISETPCFRDLGIAKRLLDSAANFNALSSLENTPLVSKIFNLLIQKRQYNYIKKLLLDIPLLTYDGSNILHFAVQNVDFNLFKCAPTNVKYLHLLDSSDKLPSDLITTESSVNLVYERLVIEYSIGKSNRRSILPTAVIPPNLLLSFTMKARKFNNSNINVKFNALISHVQSSCLYPLKSGELFYLYALQGDLELLKELLNQDPLLKYQDMTILHLAIKLNDSKLYELVPKHVKYIPLISLKEYLTSFVSHDMLLERLALEFLPVDSQSVRSCHSPSLSINGLYQSLIDFAFNQNNGGTVDENLVSYLIDFAIYSNTQDENHNFINEIFLKCAQKQLYGGVEKILEAVPLIATNSDNLKTLNLAIKSDEPHALIDHPDFVDKIISISLTKNEHILTKMFSICLMGKFYCILKKIFNVKPFILHESGLTALHLATMKEESDLFDIIPLNFKYLSLPDSNSNLPAHYANSQESFALIMRRLTIEYGLDFDQFSTTDFQTYSTVPHEVIVSIFKMSLRMKNDLVSNRVLEVSRLIDNDNKMGLLSRLFKEIVASHEYVMADKLLETHPVIIEKGVRQTILHALAINNDMNLAPLLKDDVDYFFELDSTRRKAFHYAKSKEVKEFILKRLVFEYSENVEKLSVFSYRILNSFENLFPFRDCDVNIVSQALGVLKKYDQKFGSNHFGELFNSQIITKSYDGIKIMLGIDPLVSFEGSNVLHFAAQLNDKKLFQLSMAQKNDIFYLHSLDDHMATPISYINSYEMYELFREQVNCEVGSKFWNDIFRQINTKKNILKIAKLSKRVKTVLSGEELSDNDVATTFYLKSSDNVFKTVYTQSLPQPSFYDRSVYPRIEVTNTDEGERMNTRMLQAEWMLPLIESFFKPNPLGSANTFTAPLFEIIDTESGLYAPNKNYPREVFKFAGSILALALNQCVTINAVFIESVYRKIYGIEPFHPGYLKFQSPKIYYNLPNVDPEDDFNENNYNHPAYQLLYEHYKPEIDALAEGFNANRNPKLVKYLSIEDFKTVLKGKPLTNVTADQFLEWCQFSETKLLKQQYGFSAKSEFKMAIQDLDSNQIGQLIKLITKKNSLPPFKSNHLDLEIDFRKVDCLEIELPDTLIVPASLRKQQLKAALLRAITA